MEEQTEVTVEEQQVDQTTNDSQSTEESEQSQVDNTQALLEQFEQQKAELRSLQIDNALRDKGLTPFKSIFDVFAKQDVTVGEQVTAIEQAVNVILMEKAYQPKEVAKQQAYEQAINDGDVNSAIKFKLSKFFGK
ncbi:MULTISPECIES: hypothetical protein [Lysinibacillus]|uniref:hypothetical protein n=1 Tax=Lysinibacillus TaxID=400634 RepID=UPI0021A65350|nr:hypothetical protein [Lysinibacillus capsici]MCT1538430.1 hypothetical protein [Lysinibacillus capsici]MCT1569138.1 hypothetical protein [Lysinibacillus capsici]MCT1646153.1 hypothetical protein [Lysinibacillus capsici]MCT1725341.1 hypothetical protein [Lysinibacillus capsici]MCT1784121.1 hypothetical protein [Lysinibacillus capsici]